MKRKREDSKSTPEKEEQPSSSSLPENGGFDFDVFLSFRGEDIRKGFIGHLYKDLEARGIRTFKDDQKLEKGKNISELLEAIERSEILIPVFSERYAESRWCLREISKMVECRKASSKRLIIPVFYKVEPSDVRRQRGLFGSYFSEHELNEEVDVVKGWRNSLEEAAKISGFDLDTETHGHEAKLVSLIVKRVLNELNHVEFDIAKGYPVGIDSRVDYVMKLLKTEETHDVRMVAISGEGGLGKTTIAMAISNKLFRNFEGSCFISDVREKSKPLDGLASLQSQLLTDCLKEEISINNTKEGISKIKHRMNSKRVIIILDDVDHREQLDVLAGEHGWFGAGSRIIITTRDSSILLKGCKVYKPRELDDDQALELFSLHAFVKREPPKEYIELSKEAARIAGGLPLALKVFGSHFFILETKDDWQEMLQELKRTQPNDIHKRLKISYEGLNHNAQCIFLDIACFQFLTGLDSIESVIYMWKACGYSPNVAIKFLQHKSLISIENIDDRTFYKMHDQIRDMGREIVRQEGISDHRKRSRLCDRNEALNVLKYNEARENNHIQAVFLGWDFMNSMERNSMERLSRNAFAAFDNLRMLLIHKCDFGSGLVQLPRNLKWLRANDCPMESVLCDDDECHPEELGVLQLLWCSGIRRVLRSTKTVFKRLKVLELSFCHLLMESPDFALTPCLEKLRLLACWNLLQVDESIGNLNKLESLSIAYCKELKGLPSSICKLSSLETLELSSLPISALPKGLGELKKLSKLSLSECGSLEELPDSIGDLSRLRGLGVSSCGRLLSLPRLPSSIVSLRVDGCSMTTISGVSDLKELKEFSLSDCENLVDVAGLENLKSLEVLRMDGCFSLGDGFKKRFLQVTSFGVLAQLNFSGIRVGDHFCFVIPNPNKCVTAMKMTFYSDRRVEDMNVVLQVLSESLDVLYQTTRACKKYH